MHQLYWSTLAHVFYNSDFLPAQGALSIWGNYWVQILEMWQLCYGLSFFHAYVKHKGFRCKFSYSTYFQIVHFVHLGFSMLKVMFGQGQLAVYQLSCSEKWSDGERGWIMVLSTQNLLKIWSMPLLLKISAFASSSKIIYVFDIMII